MGVVNTKVGIRCDSSGAIFGASMREYNTSKNGYLSQAPYHVGSVLVSHVSSRARKRAPKFGTHAHTHTRKNLLPSVITPTNGWGFHGLTSQNLLGTPLPV